jgi:putative flippase GtrA
MHNRIFAQIPAKQFIKFFVVGGFCASLNILIIYILTGIFQLHYLVSIAVQTILVNSIGFYLNKRFTFKQNKNNLWKGLLKYHTVMLSSLIIVSILMYLLVDIFKIWYLFAFVVVTIIMTIVNFFSHKKWTFKK